MSAEKPEAEPVVSESTPTTAGAEVLDENVTNDIPETSSSQELKDPIELLSGEALTTQEAFRITSATHAQLIVITGAVGSGKTTLIASIFHCFQGGPFANYLFAGSDTLIGFDKRCHLARTTSGRSSADTERTKAGIARKLLHLRLRIKDLNAPLKDVLISDLSGEHYEHAKDSVDECRKLGLIQRADHFILLIDGGKLIQPEDRQSAKNEATMLLRSCLDAGQLSRYSLVDVLFSKWDLVGTSENQSESIKFIDQVKLSIEQQVRLRVGRLRFFNVAARPEKSNYPLGYGLAEVFPSWVQDTPASVLARYNALKELHGMPEFDRYLRRRLPYLFNEAE